MNSLSWTAYICAREGCLYTKHMNCVWLHNECLVGLLTPLLLLFLGCLRGWISSRAWHLPYRNLIITSGSVIPWETAFIYPCFLVTSSTCSINIWNNSTSYKGMLKSNALIAFKLLWNWSINALKSVADSLLIAGSDNNDFTWAAAIKRPLLYLSYSRFQAAWNFCCVTGKVWISWCAYLVTENNK